MQDLIHWLAIFFASKNLELGQPPNSPLLVTLLADTQFQIKVYCQSAAPATPSPGDCWFNGNNLARFTSSHTWETVTAPFWQYTITHLSPDYPPSLQRYPQGIIPALEGTLMRNRLWLYAEAQDDLEAATFSQLNAVNRRLTNLQNRFDALRAQPLQAVEQLSVTQDPTLPRHAVPLQYAESKVAQLHSDLATLRSQVGSVTSPTTPELERRLDALEGMMQEVQELETLVHTTGARFTGHVFLPYQEGRLPTDDMEAVTWGMIKRLRAGSGGPQICKDGTNTKLLDGWDALGATIQVSPSVTATLRHEFTDEQGNTIMRVSVADSGKLFKLSVEVSSPTDTEITAPLQSISPWKWVEFLPVFVRLQANQTMRIEASVVLDASAPALSVQLPYAGSNINFPRVTQ